MHRRDLPVCHAAARCTVLRGAALGASVQLLFCSLCSYCFIRGEEEKPLTSSVLPPSSSVMKQDHQREHISAFLQLVHRLGAVAASCEREQAKGRHGELGTHQGWMKVRLSSLLSYPALSEDVKHLHFSVCFGVNTFLLTYPGLPSFHVMCWVGRSGGMPEESRSSGSDLLYWNGGRRQW